MKPRLHGLASWLAGWLAALAAGGLGGCADASALAPALTELERLTFVPAGAVSDPSGAFRDSPSGAAVALLVDRLEVTRRQWLEFQTARNEPLDERLSSFTERWEPATLDWPASFVTQLEASHYAASRGMRLLSAGEWLYCAVGRERRPFPWGYSAQDSIANTLELGLERPASVGTFEAGRTPLACYDMLGNVAEWTEGALPGSGAESNESAPVLGGSFRSRVRPIFDPKPSPGEPELFAQVLPRQSRADDIGFRCAAPAADYLWAHAREWGESATARSRLVEIGARWGRSSLSVLEQLSTRPDAPAALDWLAEGARR